MLCHNGNSFKRSPWRQCQSLSSAIWTLHVRGNVNQGRVSHQLRSINFSHGSGESKQIPRHAQADTLEYTVKQMSQQRQQSRRVRKRFFDRTSAMTYRCNLHSSIPALSRCVGFSKIRIPKAALCKYAGIVFLKHIKDIEVASRLC